MVIEVGSLEYNLLLLMTLIVLFTKLILTLFLAKKIYDKWKETGEITFGFITSVFIMMLCLFVSRLFYIVYDFEYTLFDPDLFYTYPAIMYWKIATLISMVGYATFLFAVDRKILEFKFKGIFSYIIIVLGITAFIYPVKTLEDFNFISTILLFANVVAIIIPILFFYIGKNPEYRKPAYLTAIGIILFAIGASIINETLVVLLNARLLLQFISLILKVSGLVLFSYAITKFISILK